MPAASDVKFEIDLKFVIYHHTETAAFADAPDVAGWEHRRG